MSRAEAELLAGFDRLRPQGSVRWAFEDAMRRIDEPDLSSSAGAHPWTGLPDDLWERGRSAQIGQRLVGDVAKVMADILAADARAAADAAVGAVNGDRFVATWDALQYLSARVAALEARVDPLGLEVAEWPLPPPDQTPWAAASVGWFSGVDAGLPVVVGESGDGTLIEALRAGGRPALGVDPRGATVWRSLTVDEPSSDAGVPVPDISFDHVHRHLRSVPSRSVAGVVLIGAVDRADLAGQLDLVDEAIRVTVSGGRVVILTVDQLAWEASLSHPARDLAQGRPLHPETWLLLLGRLGIADPAWLEPRDGDVHAIVARVDR
jgi:hypothetical protein